VTIETLIHLDEIPQALQDFDRALTEYCRKHKLRGEVSESHFIAIQKLAAKYGVMMERDGTARLLPPVTH
jgi:hypothetical protein